MKKTFCIILFLALAVRPVYHLGYIGYFALNIDYIIETYCVNKEKPQLQCNGKCHLAKKIAPKVDVTKDDVQGFTVASDAFFPVFHQQIASFVLQQITFQKRKLIFKKNSLYAKNFSSGLEQPPDFHL
ncbi:hypothetical protein [uncultured Polaribacter sp.]|uniref:hypothetical protein n=1 Tax=uncultured Polaribacter sp. TaxID=174711 RepID=UPI002621D133|nr:hypothetical protein [uncultured Polaribacter sp.]